MIWVNEWCEIADRYWNICESNVTRAWDLKKSESRQGPVSPWVLVAQWIERPFGVRDVMDSCRDSDFPGPTLVWHYFHIKMIWPVNVISHDVRTVNLWLANFPFENGDRYKFRCKWLKNPRRLDQSRGMIMIILLGNQQFFVSRTYSMGISDSARLLRWAWVFITEIRYELIYSDARRLET